MLTLAYFFFGNSVAYQQSVEQQYQTKYATLKQQRDELIAMERYWAIEVEGLKREEQRQLVEKKKLEQRESLLAEREKLVSDILQKESEAHTPFQENGPNYVKYILETKCGGAKWLANYSIMHQLRRRGNLKPSHLVLNVSNDATLAEHLVTFANAFALSYKMHKAFFVDNSTLMPFFSLFEPVLLDWKTQPSLLISPFTLDVQPKFVAQRETQLTEALAKADAAQSSAYLYLRTNHVGALESLHQLARDLDLPMAWHLEAGCILHQLIKPSTTLLGGLEQYLPSLTNADTFTVAIYAPSAQLGRRWTIQSLLSCATNVTSFHALHGSNIRWFVITDSSNVRIPQEHESRVKVMLLNKSADMMDDAVALYTLAYSRVRILTEGLLGRVGAMMSLRFGATYYMPTNSRCGPEDTTSLDDLEFT